MAIQIGLRGEATLRVSREHTASAMGSGDVEVLATPMLVALLERAAVQALSGSLEEGQTSVGGWIAVKHLAPTPVGLEARAVAELIQIEGNKLTFALTAHDPYEKIAEGLHNRYIVERGRFLARTEKKRGG